MDPTRKRRGVVAAAAGGVALLAAAVVGPCGPPPPSEPVAGDPNQPTYTRTLLNLPYDGNTGPSNDPEVLDEHDLPRCPGQPATGAWTITTTGLTVERCAITTRVIVRADGVTLQSVTVQANTSAPIITNEANSLVVADAIISPLRPGEPAGSTGEACAAAIGYARYRLEDSEVTGCADGVKVGGTTEILRNFVHGQPKTRGANGTTHNDSGQKNDNTPLTRLVVEGNAFYGSPCTSNRHWQMKNTDGAHVTMRGNFFYGYNGVINDDGNGAPVSGSVTGNAVAGSPDAGPFGPVRDLFTVGSHWSNVDFSDNLFESSIQAGEAVWVPPHGRLDAGYTCDRMPYVPTTEQPARPLVGTTGG